MKKLKTKEIEKLDEKTLIQRIAEMRKELIKHNAQISTGTTPKSPGEVKQIKKNIARIKTLQNKIKK